MLCGRSLRFNLRTSPQSYTIFRLPSETNPNVRFLLQNVDVHKVQAITSNVYYTLYGECPFTR